MTIVKYAAVYRVVVYSKLNFYICRVVVYIVNWGAT